MASQKGKRPWEVHGISSPFKIATEVRESKIPGAGLGRFALEDCPKGTVVRSHRFMSVSEYIDSAAVADSSMGAIEIQGAADLDALVSYYASSPEEMDEIRPTVASFVAGIQSAYSADGQSFMFMLFPVSHVNHSPSPNIRENRKGDLWFVQSIADIKAGDEILSDYTVFYFSDEVREWHKRHNLMDCTTFAESLKA